MGRTATIMLQLLRLYRMDVAAISFGAYAAGLVFTGGVEPRDLPTGLAISLISFNFIYSYNAIHDREIDRINKPGRIIPGQALPLAVARGYAALLLALSILYPFLVYQNFTNLALFLLLPLLGWAYSAPPLHLKTRLVPAVTTICVGYVTPIAIGLTSRAPVLTPEHAVVLGYVFLFALSVVPLKDIEDVQGDEPMGSRNWLSAVGLRRLLLLSTIGLAVSVVLVLATGISPRVDGILISFSGGTAGLLWAYRALRLPPRRLYRSVLILIAVLGLLFFAFGLVFGGVA